MSPPPPPRWPVERASRWLLAIAIVALLKAAEQVLVPVALAVVLTFVLAPAVRALRRHLRVPEVLGAALLVGALIGSTGALGSMLVGPAARWLDQAPGTLAQLIAQFDRLRASIPLLAPPPPPPQPVARGSKAPAAPAPPPADPVKEKIASEGVALTRVVIGHLFAFGLSAAATVILLYFLLASEHWMLSRTVEAIPRRRARALVVAGVRAAQQEISRFLGALALINIGVAAVVWLVLSLIGLPNAMLWGAVAGLLNFIPYIGPILTFGLLFLAGLMAFPDGSATTMLMPAIAFMGVHAVESNLVSPLFVGHRLSLSPISVFLAVLFLGWLWGIPGAVIAVPVLVGVRSICKRNRRLRLLCVYLEGDQRRTPSLRALLRPRRPAPGVGTPAMPGVSPPVRRTPAAGAAPPPEPVAVETPLRPG